MTYPNYLQVGGPPLQVPPIREEPKASDMFDPERLRYAWSLWDGQTAALLQRDRSIEENVRMLCGQQDIFWSETQQQFVDLSSYLDDKQRARGGLPRLNRLVTWFLQCKARMVENPPILTFLPGPDAIDAQLAETMDVLFKAQWRDLGMADVHDAIASWNLVAGSAYLESRIDTTTGEPQEWRGEAEIPVIDPLTQQPIPNPETGEIPWLIRVPNLPLKQDGTPQAVMEPGPNGEMVPRETGAPYVSRSALIPEVYGPLQIRGEWGDSPWHRKKWHAKRCFLTRDQVHDRYGQWVEPTALGIQVTTGTGALERLMFGSGYFGAASHAWGTFTAGPMVTGDSFVEVLCLWEAPNDAHEGYAQTEESPGGRYLCVTRDTVLWDSQRALPYPYTSPLREFRFLNIPGRPSGTTIMEFLVPIQRTYNRTWGSIQKHVNLMTNPMWMVDNASGLTATEITNEPGQKFNVNRRSGVPAIEAILPPPLGKEVFEQLGLLLQEFNDIGSLNGTQADEVGRDASGELVKELRVNSDRFIAATMREWVEEYSRVAEDWMTIFPVLWPTEKIIRYAGEDNVARTLTVLPMMFETGKVNVQPDVESMLPEGRGERQAKVRQMFLDGLMGPEEYLTMARFPNLARTPQLAGGVQRVTAQHILGRLMQGDPEAVTLWLPWYKPPVHLDVLEQFIGSPEFLKLGPQAQEMFQARWQFLQLRMQEYVAIMQQNAASTAQPSESSPRSAPGSGAPKGGDSQDIGPAPARRGPSPSALS